jgi:hypothetical protein
MLLVSHSLGQAEDADKVLGHVVVLLQEQDHS